MSHFPSLRNATKFFHASRTSRAAERGTRFRLLRIEGLEKRELLTTSPAGSPMPALTVNDGAELTNLRTVDVSFENVADDARSVRFAFNGFNYGDWQGFQANANVTIPNYYGTNWVNAEILHGDGSVRMLYDSIIYARPNIELNGGQETTNTREVAVSFGDVALDAVGLKFAFNGFNYQAPVQFEPTTTVTLPNYVGRNYVNVQIVYAEGATRAVWDSIEYRRASMQIDDDDSLTNSREVTLSFGDVSTDAEQVSIAFNGFNYGAPLDFEPAMQVTLPNWEGANYVNAKVHYDDGRELWLWDTIDYVAPVVVQSCNECVTFELHIKDGRNEGFRDPGNGDERVKAFKYAMGIWSGHLQAAYANETITVAATMDHFEDSDPNDGVMAIGSAGPASTHSDAALPTSYRYGAALANHLAGKDLDTTKPEITAAFAENYNWYFGLSDAPWWQTDFATVVLHEIGHGLNFTDMLHPNGAWFFTTPGVFDSFLVDGQDRRLTDMNQAERVSALTSGDLYWDGSAASAANGGVAPKIYAPTSYEEGSSISHLDEGAHGDELMSPSISGTDHAVSALELGMLKDMGWALT